MKVSVLSLAVCLLIAYRGIAQTGSSTPDTQDEAYKPLDLGILTTRVSKDGTISHGKSRLYADVVLNRSDKSKAIVISMAATRDRGPEPLARALGGMIGSKMMTYRRHGWHLRSQGIYRLRSTGTQYGRFDYSIRANDGATIYQAIILVPGPGSSALKVEVATRFPFDSNVEAMINTSIRAIKWKS